jgi:DNA processing protein
MEERYFWLGFSAFPGVGPGRFGLLLQKFGKAKVAWTATEEDLAEVIGQSIAKRLVDFRREFLVEEYAEQLQRAGVRFLILSDAAYPQLLLTSKNPPFVLYVKGTFDFASLHCPVGVVGSRRVSVYGTGVTDSLVRELVGGGCEIVSGLALGVDSVAHAVTIREGGKTIAVLGCGVDCCSPGSNQVLYERILDSGGVVVSEFPLGMSPTKGSFPSRNRIIAGLSVGVLVTEGAEDSGALITAKDAFLNGRKVFAVPGPIQSDLSKGPYALIRKGATLVTNGDEILAEIGLRESNHIKVQGSPRKGDTPEEQMILDRLGVESLHFDMLMRQLHLKSAELGGLLSVMEMKGFVVSLGGGMWGIRT